MSIRSVQHVALCVDDLVAAEIFYALLGFAPIPRPDFGIPGAWLQAGTAQVHLMQMSPVPDAGFNHFALEVDDVETIAAALEAAGVKVDRSPHIPGAGRQAFVLDPSGNQVELNQPD